MIRLKTLISEKITGKKKSKADKDELKAALESELEKYQKSLRKALRYKHLPKYQEDIEVLRDKIKDTKDAIKTLMSEQMDLNDPVLMHARAQKDNWELEKQLNRSMRRGAGKGQVTDKKREALEDELWDIAQDLRTAYADRRNLVIDMEQEAEPEGGAVADEYGSMLNTLDAEIEALKKRRDAIEARLG